MAKDAIDTFLDKMGQKVVKLKKTLERDTKALPCPICNGFCDIVPMTQKEIKKHDCGKGHQCCSQAFKCRLCGIKIIVGLEAPDMRD